MEAVIKAAATAACRETKAEPLSSAPLELGPLDLVFGEAVLAADLISA